MDKRGQLTIFIVLGLIIISGIVLFFVLKEVESDIPKEVKEIEIFVENCLEDTGKISVKQVSAKGGYFVLTDEQIVISNSVYYFYENKLLTPTKEKVEQSLSSNIYENLDYCVRNFIDFPDYNVSHELSDVSVEIKENGFSVFAEYNLIISYEGFSYEIKNFEAFVSSGIENLCETSKEISELYSETPGEICLSCLYPLLEEKKINLETVEYGNSIIFKLREKEQLNEEEYIFALEW